MSSAGDEYNVETHSKDGKKRVHEQDDHTVQKAAEFIAGGDVKTSSGRDTTLVASKISAGNEAYVYARNDLNLLAAQNKDHTLYDMKEKGGFGNLKLQRDEVTQVTHVGSEIKTGGNLSLVSLGDQHYQVAKLDSGKDILLDSGGAITFEGVKDLHDESHTKTNNNAAWVSAKGRGNTDETLRQTQMIAKGNIVLKAVDGLKIDIKDVSQESVSQTIDAMVKADPQLAWLKDAEARGDVDWRRVKEIHESFKYSNSGLGPASQMIIAIVMAAVVGPAALTALSGMGTFWAATFAAVATGAATNATTSFINNGGDLGAVFADVTSSDALQGYVVSGLTAGLMSQYLNELTGVKFDPNGKYAGPSLATWEGVSKFAGSQIIQGSTSALISKAVGGDADLGNLLQTALFNTVAAFSFNMVGDLTTGVVDDGSATKVIIHAAVGGLLSEMTGGDFATGALAAGANEALVKEMNNWFKGNPDLLIMGSQIVGVLAASTQENVDAETLQNGAWITANATKFNYQGHYGKYLEKYETCKNDATGVGCSSILKLAGTNSQVLGNFVLNMDVDSKIVSYTLLDDSGKPWMIMEPLEYKAYVALPVAMQDAYKNSAQWQFDLSSTLLYAKDGQEGKAIESYEMMLTDPDYWGEMALSLMLSSAGGSVLQGVKGAAGSLLKLGETKVINNVSMTRVGRWMSPGELLQMQGNNRVVQGAGGQTFISINGAADFKGAASKGAVYVEFDVPSNGLLQGGKEGWYKMIGQDASKSQQYLLKKQGGEHLPEVKNIKILDRK